MDSTSPATLSFPLNRPINGAQSELAGSTRAMGLPWRVTRIPSGPRLPRIARHSSLNLDALTFSIPLFYTWTDLLSIFAASRRPQVVSYLRADAMRLTNGFVTQNRGIKA